MHRYRKIKLHVHVTYYDGLEDRQTAMATEFVGDESLSRRMSYRFGRVHQACLNSVAVRGNLYTIYQLIEFSKYYCLMAAQ